jgi:hypothetical protein
MARIARTQDGIARAALMADLNVARATGATVADFQAIMMDDDNAYAMACMTRDAFGGRRMGAIFDAMVEHQNHKCWMCTRRFYSGSDPISAGTTPEFLLLLPSALWADVEVSGKAAHQSGWTPGNIVVTCQRCATMRDRASEAMGGPVCITADIMHPNQIARVMLEFPKSVKASGIDATEASVVKADAIRMAQFGF